MAYYKSGAVYSRKCGQKSPGSLANPASDRAARHGTAQHRGQPRGRHVSLAHTTTLHECARLLSFAYVNPCDLAGTCMLVLALLAQIQVSAVEAAEGSLNCNYMIVT